MILYSSDLISWKFLSKLIFRGGYLRKIKNILKLIFSKKIIKKSKYKFVAYTHNRLQENRVYGIVEIEKKLYFFKISENIFIKYFNQTNTTNEFLKDFAQDLIPNFYKHRLLSRFEFEKFGFGLKDSIYHGDISKGNILAYKDDVILIDDEYKSHYSKLFQNLDYLINVFQENNIDSKNIYNINWWFKVLQIYSVVTKDQLIEVFKKRKKNGCDFSKKIIRN
tara:strand:+ start:2576 stop:3241 length:666 start_codon:yes stop_codon:yes gene_type:complete